MKVTRKEFLAFEAVRQSGATNMMDIRAVSGYAGLKVEQCKEIIKRYNDLSVAFENEEISEA